MARVVVNAGGIVVTFVADLFRATDVSDNLRVRLTKRSAGAGGDREQDASTPRGATAVSSPPIYHPWTLRTLVNYNSERLVAANASVARRGDADHGASRRKNFAFAPSAGVGPKSIGPRFRGMSVSITLTPAASTAA